MTQVDDSQEPLTTLVADRRRPGRIKNANPELIPILRGDGAPLPPEKSFESDDDDQLSGARGVVVGIALSAPLWLGIAYLGRWLLS